MHRYYLERLPGEERYSELFIRKGRLWLPILIALFAACLPGLSPLAPAQEEGGETPPSRENKLESKASPDAISGAIGALLKARTKIERALAESRLKDFGPQALDAVRKARGEVKAAEISESLRRAEVHILAGRLAEVVQERIATGLYYDGQYADLQVEGPLTVEALLQLFNDEEVGVPVRIGSAHALADLAEPSSLPALRKLRSDPLLAPGLRNEVGILMAILGDTRHVDRRIRRLSQTVGSRNPRVALSTNYQLADLYYKIRNYSKATECYERIVRIFPRARQLSPDVFTPKELAINHYNAACSYALGERIEKAKGHLRKAVQLDLLHFKNMEKDGDLKNLRESPGYDEFKEELFRLMEKGSI